MLSAQVVEVMLSECFPDSAEVMRGHLSLKEQVHVAVALPVPVVLVLYQDKRDSMKNQGMCFSCHSCGKVVEHSPAELPCEVLKGWLTVSYWKGPGSVERYNFCSYSCLESWVDARLPKVPQVFLDSFKEDKD